MSTRDISEGKLLALAKYLDRFPPLAPGQHEDDVEQYYCILLEELGRLPPPLGAKFTYSRSQKVTFGMATVNDGSPSIHLLRDLQKKGLPLDAFISCLEKIGCQGALNEFVSATRPEIIANPQSHNLHEGETLQLTCQARCKPGPPHYFWFRKRDTNSSQDWEPLVNSQTNRLVIADVNTDHTGVYICRATNPRINDPNKANVFTAEVRVDVEKTEIQQKTPIRQVEEGHPLETPPEFPLIVVQPESVRVEYGQPAALHCKALGTNIAYDWFKDGKYISTPESAGSVILTHAKVEDSGRYYCKVTNSQAGSATSRTATVIVDPVIVIDSQPRKDLRGDRGERMVLRCSAHSSKGPVVYQWLRNKRVVKDATSEEYRDVFKCHSGSSMYSMHCRVSLRDNSNVSLLSTPTKVTVDCVKITEPPRDVQAEIKGSSSLHCTARVIPPSSTNDRIKYFWLKSDSKGGRKDPLSPALKARHSEGRLSFDRLQIAHGGYYVCQACYKDRWVESNEVQLSVTMPGVARVDIVRHPVSWVLAPGGSFRMRCKAKVTPPQTLHYQWYKNNSPIPEETSSELKRTKVAESDYASYYCEVRTDSGVPCASKSAYLKQASRTEPTNVGGASILRYEAEQKLTTLSGERYAREKVALLIGNQKYATAGLNRLRCTEEEVRKVAEKLRQFDFKVFTFVNLRLKEMDEVIKWFCSLLSAGMYGLFYYSGHGFSIGNISYLMPVDCPEGPTDTHVCIATDLTGNRMQKSACQAIMVLDCCRIFVDDSIQSGSLTSSFESLNVANIVEIHSCPRGNEAYEGSSFSRSFIAALDQNHDVNRLCSEILHKMRSEKDGATPVPSGSMKNEISLKDQVMRDDLNKETDAEKICDLWEEVQSVPGVVTLADAELNGLGELLSVKLRCRTQFTNVLTVTVEWNLKRNGITLTLTLDVESLKEQGVEAKVVPNTDGSLSYEIRNMQRLTARLALPIVLTVSAPGSADRKEQIVHTFPELPLNTFLKLSN